MASVTFDSATRIFSGATKPAVDNLNLEIADGEFLVLVGPSGCGKSTSLRMVSGLEPTTSGRILIGAEDMTRVRPRKRDVAMVFQSYALYPNMTVAQNMAFALENAKIAKSEIEQRVNSASKMLELDELLHRKPAELSGGQRQRVAMGRAIVRKPTVYCMDEPLSNLDAKLRVSMRGEIASLQRRLGVTTIYVTHDQVEAMTMGHRVAVMKDGQLQQVDTPKMLYANPANAFVAGFIGSPSINFFHCRIDNGHAVLGSYLLPIPRNIVAKVHGEILLGVRPESWEVVSPGTPGIEISADLVEMLGAQTYLYGKMRTQVDDDHAERIAVLLTRGTNFHVGEVLTIRPRQEEIHYFDAESEITL
ncbi:ABC transporter ATP-binding protein [Arcanobacterium hippocoleae]|uniref:Sn-glycerol 3-phosphate transport system ATP-binding protein/multiple sugar transport system ATP-binding protein n=1 Tax=Arcanobacterium hippocoleae TaxID=149017 RepID=A0ABU1T5G2_9ACTO|nr:sn-glycerol-3-phosphate ABC transporter ATP-binding protein UgpC [Arcanobacterium hippocoleae]MDR6940080.1 sn-glycerol 3-phosphate transport system ATP-binding protein/multiple sugar transport system ATP-binding protein [Arcanobacterium hippocoleae]